MSVAPFVQPFPSGRAFWQESRDSGASYAAPPAAASTTQVVGPTGAQRLRHLFTIPAGLGGTFTVTVSGDIFANPPNVPAELVYDGVSQGTVTPLTGPKTFTLPVVSGAHDLQLWIGQANAGGGATVPVVSANFAGVTLAGIGAAGCCCPVSDHARCYRVITGAPFQHAYAVDCGDGVEWRDITSGASVPPADIENCGCGVLLEMPDLVMNGSAFNDAPNEFICNVSPEPASTTGFTDVGVCYDPTAASPTITWAGPISGVQKEYGSAAGTSGGVLVTYTSSITGPVTWPTNLVNMNPGEQRISQPLLGGIRAVLTYISGPLGGSPSGSIRMEGGATLGLHRLATSIVAPIQYRLDFYSPPCA